MVQVEVALFKEDDIYVAYSPSLDLAGQGDNHEEAIIALKENIHITFEWAMEHKTIHELLLDLGWSIKTKPVSEYKPPVLTPDQIEKLIATSHYKMHSMSVYA